MFKVIVYKLPKHVIDTYINSNPLEAPTVLTRNEVENGVTRTRTVRYFDCKPSLNSNVICGRF